MSLTKTIGIMLSSFAITIIALSIAFHKPNDRIIMRWRPDHENVVEMPIVQNSNPTPRTTEPKPQTGSEVETYLATSVKIKAGNISGSGTIIYYNPQTKEAYVASCGHLWQGSGINYQIVAYYNNAKLAAPKTYNAKVLFWSGDRGYDCSLLIFTPDWEPEYFPIAPIDFELTAGVQLHSCGCDGGGPVAHYSVNFVEYRGSDLVTQNNSPRPGRSGGGLFSTDGYYVGTCWGTSDKSGRGVGYFTPLASIYSVYEKNGYGWILNVSKLAQSIPIIDKSYPKRQWDQNKYILNPGKLRISVPK
jgi:hypothetical protein